MRAIMDTRGSIFVVNLSKGAVSDDKAHLIGSFIVGLCRMAAMQREDAPEEGAAGFPLDRG